jgi:hypothetical protein
VIADAPSPGIIKVSFHFHVTLTLLYTHPARLAAIDQAGSIDQEHIRALSSAIEPGLSQILKDYAKGMTVHYFLLLLGNDAWCLGSFQGLSVIEAVQTAASLMGNLICEPEIGLNKG